jgi:hypothetical protein
MALVMLTRRVFLADLGRGAAAMAVLGSLTFERLYVGHGEPIETGASLLVKALGGG